MSKKLVKKAIEDKAFRKLLLADPSKELKPFIKKKAELKEATRIARLVAKQSPKTAMSVLKTFDIVSQ